MGLPIFKWDLTLFYYFFIVKKNRKPTFTLNNFYVYSTVLLTVSTLLYNRSLELSRLAWVKLPIDQQLPVSSSW